MKFRTISSPLKFLDCCLVSDGAAAVIVSDGAHLDSSLPRVEILGAAKGIPTSISVRRLRWLSSDAKGRLSKRLSALESALSKSMSQRSTTPSQLHWPLSWSRWDSSTKVRLAPQRQTGLWASAGRFPVTPIMACSPTATPGRREGCFT
jgi:hypothetical protein